MTEPNDNPSANDLENSDLGLWDAIPIDVSPTTPTPVVTPPPPARLRVNAIDESPESVSLSVEQSDVGIR